MTGKQHDNQGVPPADLRVGVIGAGLIGINHIRRLTGNTARAVVAGVVEPDGGRLEAALAAAPGAKSFPDAQSLIASGDVDALIVATYGDLHEPVVMEAIDANMPCFVEKPLTRDSVSALRVTEAEQALDQPVIQVGFMRRFDSEYVALKGMVDSGEHGELLMLHMAHRLASYRDGATATMPITDALVHELDMAMWLSQEPFVSIEVKRSRHNSLSDPALIDPQLVVLETESGRLVTVELNVGAQFGYQATTEAVFEAAVVNCGRTAGPEIRSAGRWGGPEHPTYAPRFDAAFATQLQRWVDAALCGGIDGANAWDGYLATLVAEAGVKSQEMRAPITVSAEPRPSFYRTM
jgi:myo-inositol 2-dehydrogenase/D-chiro-inositol 1-dehydrogenase